MKIWSQSLLLLGLIFTSSAESADSTIYLIGNAHIDLAYRWRWNETVDRVGPDTFAGVLRMMDKIPDLTFAQSQVALYEEMEIRHPELFKRICAKMEEKRWALVGGQWAEPDAILPSGESFIRQFLIGMEYARSHLGVEQVDVAWVPDSFCGQALTLPQIYSGCGIRHYVFGRGAPKDKRVFWWEAPDGSRILAYNYPLGYGLTRPNASILAPIQNWFKMTGLSQTMVLFGEGDHGGGPRDPDIEAIDALRNRPEFPHIVYATPQQYFAQLEASGREWPVFRGEIGIGEGEDDRVAGAWRGSFTSQARTKKRNRDSENLLITAEKFATLGSMLQRKPLFPRVDFRQAWKVVLRNQFHDILPGTSIGDVFTDALADYAWVESEGNRLLRFGLEVIGSRIDTRGRGVALVVYNPHSWLRTDVVEAEIRFMQPSGPFTIQDAAQRPVSYQIRNWSQDSLTANVLILTEKVPAMGYKLLRVHAGQTQNFSTDLKIEQDRAENEFLAVAWDDRGVTSLYDKRLARELLDGPGNVWQILGENRSSSWDLVYSGETLKTRSLGAARVVEKGPVRLVVRWQDACDGSRFVREMSLCAGVPRLDFSTTVDWHDHDRLVKLAFATEVKSGVATYEQPFGAIVRPNNGTDWPAQNWLDLSNRQFGLALLNDGKYGFDVTGRVMRMSVVRGARDMDPRMDEGVHRFGHALYPHAGDWRSGDVTQRAMEFNQPLIAMQENSHIGNIPDWGGGRINEYSNPAEKSFVSIDSDHVIVSALKVQQGDWSPANIILRIFETEGRDDLVTVKLPATPKQIVQVNHIEDPIPEISAVQINDQGFTFKIGHNQIRTFLIGF